jgi:hypothetical protein
MGFFEKLFGSDKKPIHKPRLYELGSTIASIIDAFIAQEDLNSLLKPQTAIAMDDHYSVFLTQAVETARDRQNIRAVAYLKDVPYFEQFRKIQTDSFFSASPLTYMATDQLAAEVLRKLLEQTGNLFSDA